MTDAELCLWSALRNKQMGCKFRRQHPYENYILDFVCLEHRLVVEVDGSQHARQTGYDNDRTALLQQAGFKVMRFWNNDVLNNLDSVTEQIWLTIQAMQTHPHPDPPLEGEGSIITAS